MNPLTVSAISTPPLPEFLLSGVPKTFITVNELRKKYPNNYFHLRNEEIINLPSYPLNDNNHPKYHNRPWNNTLFPKNFVFVIPRGRIFGRNGLGMTPENEIISNTIQGWEPQDHHSLFQRETMPPLQRIPQRIVVIALNGAASYYHWMFEVLPRLKLLQDSRIEFDKIYIPSILYPFQMETLKKCGIFEDQIYEGYKDTYIEANELIIPSLITTECCTHPIWACHFLQSTFLDKPMKENISEKKLFIVRREFTSHSKRSIINEMEVSQFLQAQGFEKIVLEDLSVSEQANLFARAKIIVAAHGAGLTNLVFCKPGTKVIELFNPHHLDETYWFLSHQLGLEHHCLQPSTDLLTIEQKESCDIYLPTDLLLNFPFIRESHSS